MSDRLFDDTPPDPPRGEPSFRVVEISQLISGALDTLFPDDLWVEGEISNLTRSRAGHVYFDLVEPAEPGTPSTARISVVLFSQTKQIVNAQLKRHNVGRLADGMAVRIRASIDYYPPQGRLQLRMTGIDPRYLLAAMAAEREALLARLHAEGIIETNKALPVPLVPLRIGLVTSVGSAASADFLTELAASPFAFEVAAVDARVQGELATRSLIAGIRTLEQQTVDMVVVIRGGGSRGDLSVFDNEQLARAIASCPVPVWTGIGHEIDRSIADEVAHASFKTPTAVATALCEQVGTYMHRCEVLWASCEGLADRRLRHASEHLGHCAHRAASAGRTGLDRISTTLDTAASRLPRQAERIDRAAHQRIDHIEALVRASDPAHLLRRGWSITRTADGNAIRTIADADAGTTLVTTVLDGSIHTTVNSTEPKAETHDEY